MQLPVLPPKGASPSPRSGYDTIPHITQRDFVDNAPPPIPLELPKRVPVVPAPYNPPPISNGSPVLPPKPPRPTQSDDDDDPPPSLPQRSNTLSQRIIPTPQFGSNSSLEPTQEDEEVSV